MITQICCVSVLLVLINGLCEPLYWEVDPTYNATTEELVSIANKAISPNDISQMRGKYLNKTTYTLKTINGNITYDRSQEEITHQNNTINVSGSIFNIIFSFNATAGKYEGNGTAKIDGITISYSKTPAIKNGNATYNISNVVVKVPTVVPSGDYKPTPSSDDIAEFNGMLIHNLTEQVNSYFNSSLSQFLSKAASQNGFPYSFDKKPYNYTYSLNEGTQSVLVDTSVTYLQVFDTGYVIGYNGSVNSNNTECSEFIPNNSTKKASFFSVGFVKLFFNEYLHKFKVWNNVIVDHDSAKSTFFGFRIADLQSILEDLTNAFPNLLDKIQARCIIDQNQNPEIQLRQTQNQIRLKAGWNCGLYTVKDATLLLNFHTVNQYRLTVNQASKFITVQIVDVSSISSQWIQAQYKIINQKLANIYLTEIASKFNGQYTLGTKFMQPLRQFSKVSISAEAIQIYDAATLEVII